MFTQLSLTLPLAEKSYTVGVGLTLLCVILGLLIALRPTKRVAEFKRQHEN